MDNKNDNCDGNGNDDRDQSNIKVDNNVKQTKIQLEQIVTCPIHLGIMKDPKKLTCQHSFCSICLENLLRHSSKLECPICRHNETIDKKLTVKDVINNLPLALVESQLLEVIMREREVKKSDSICEGSDTVNGANYRDNDSGIFHFVIGGGSVASSRERLHQWETNVGSSVSNNDIAETGINLTTQSVTSQESTYDLMDIEIIRENMLAYSEYKMLNRKKIRKICKPLANRTSSSSSISSQNSSMSSGANTRSSSTGNCAANVCSSQNNSYSTSKDSSTNSVFYNCNEISEFKTFDVDLLNHQLVIVSAERSQIEVYDCSDQKRVFVIKIAGSVVRPNYIRVYGGELYFTGSYISGDTCKFVFINTDMYGNIIQKSVDYESPHKTISNNTSSMTMYGFDVSWTKEKIFICFPQSREIRIFNTALKEQQHYYQFENNQPEYVAYYRQQDQIWVTCPRDKRILIVDLHSGAFRQFQTEQINKAVPTLIACTDDDRIIFLDNVSNRFIWIKRRNDYILTQKLNMKHNNPCLGGHGNPNNEFKITNFQVLPGSMLIVCNDHSISLFQPAKASSKTPKLLCTLL